MSGYDAAFHATFSAAATGNLAERVAILHRIPRPPIAVSGAGAVLAHGLVPITVLASVVTLLTYFHVLHAVAPELQGKPAGKGLHRLGDR